MPTRMSIAALGLVIAGPAWAQSLDCSTRDPDVCAAVNELVPLVNAEAGSVVLSQGSTANRMRPTTIYSRLLQVKLRAVAAGCTVDGFAGGVYDAGATQAWSGPLVRAADGRTWDGSGTVTAAPPVWTGVADDGVQPLDIGDRVGLHNAAGQVAANVEDAGFLGGVWMRRVGARGVYAALTGFCPGGTDAGDALDPWFSGDLPSFGGAGADYALSFDGDDVISGDAVHLGVSLDNDHPSWSVSAWVRNGSSPNSEGIVVGDHFCTVVSGFFLGVGAGGFSQFYVDGPRVYGPFVDDGGWHQLVGTYDGATSTATLYVDGAFAASFGAPSNPTGLGLRVGSGHYPDVGGGPVCATYRGEVDDVVAWDHARTASEVAQDYASQLASGTTPDGGTPGVYLSLPLDEGTGTSTADSSGNGRDGLLLAPPNTPTWVAH